MLNKLLPLGALVIGLSAPAFAASPSAETSKLYFISPQDGEAVTSPVAVRFGLTGMGVAPAGVDKPLTGHHHLLIDVDELPPMNLPLPKDERHRHFGGGQTEAVIDLEPGTHTLQLILGDANHMPHDPPVVSDRITISVDKID